ncbi:uncharacterized protein [Dermacentor andersoni]|uniref:uncharacterized protein isoform X2 n=1 Tax=Dermacentor andersoni TaxID=34620 RepID=UPI0024163D14|nr:uncharacterized protein LOC129380303 isoform X2 [Dermacentor andersoni]
MEHLCWYLGYLQLRMMQGFPIFSRTWMYGEIQNPCRFNGYSEYPCLLRMDVSDFNTTKTVKELERRVLMSWHRHPGCGVYVVLDGNRTRGCELHARQKALEQREVTSLIHCEADFYKYCKNDIQIAQYSENCN